MIKIIIEIIRTSRIQPVPKQWRITMICISMSNRKFQKIVGFFSIFSKTNITSFYLDSVIKDAQNTFSDIIAEFGIDSGFAVISNELLLWLLKNVCYDRGKPPAAGCWHQNTNRKTLESAGFITESRLLKILL
jgi:hypothetical protein